MRNGLNDVRRAGPSVAKALDATTLLQKTFRDKPRLSPTKDLKTQPSPVKKPSGTRDWARRRDMLAPPPPTPSPPPSQVEKQLAAVRQADSTPRVSPDTSPRVAQSTPPSVPKTTPARPAKTSIRDKEPRTPPVKGAGLRLFESPPSPSVQRRPFSDGDRAPTDAADVEVAAALASVVEAVDRAAAQDRSPGATLASAAKREASAAAADAAAAAERARAAAAAAAAAAEQPAPPFDITSSEWSPLRRAVRSRVLALEARLQTPPATPKPARPAAPPPRRGPLVLLGLVGLGGAAALALLADPSLVDRLRAAPPAAAPPRPAPPPDFVADLRRPPAPPPKTCRSAINAPAPRPAPTVVVRKRGPLAPLRKLIDLLLLGPLRRRLFGGGR